MRRFGAGTTDARGVARGIAGAETSCMNLKMRRVGEDVLSTLDMLSVTYMLSETLAPLLQLGESKRFPLL